MTETALVAFRNLPSFGPATRPTASAGSFSVMTKHHCSYISQGFALESIWPFDTPGAPHRDISEHRPLVGVFCSSTWSYAHPSVTLYCCQNSTSHGSHCFERPPVLCSLFCYCIQRVLVFLSRKKKMLHLPSQCHSSHCSIPKSVPRPQSLLDAQLLPPQLSISCENSRRHVVLEEMHSSFGDRSMGCVECLAKRRVVSWPWGMWPGQGKCFPVDEQVRVFCWPAINLSSQ